MAEQAASTVKPASELLPAEQANPADAQPISQPADTVPAEEDGEGAAGQSKKGGKLEIGPITKSHAHDSQKRSKATGTIG